VSASSKDFSAATSAHASDGEVVGAALVGAALAAAGPDWLGLVWVGAELVPQLVRMHSSATAATALNEDRWAPRSRIWVFS